MFASAFSRLILSPGLTAIFAAVVTYQKILAAGGRLSWWLKAVVDTRRGGGGCATPCFEPLCTSKHFVCSAKLL